MLAKYYYTYMCSGNECEWSRGRWVRSEEEPLYTNETCRFIPPNQDCVGNGRPDTGYMRWRWEPLGCVLPAFDANEFLRFMRNKKMLFVGDSISRNHMQSLLCALSQVPSSVNCTLFLCIFWQVSLLVVFFLLLLFCKTFHVSEL